MVKEPWDYDSRSHQVILNVRGDRHGRRRKKRANGTEPSLLNRPRVVVLGVVLTILIFSFLREARSVLISNPRFKIQQILIENTELLDQTSLIQILDLKGNTEDTLFSVSAKELSRRLEKDPDIESAIVEKKFPDTLRVVVKERIPYARIRVEEKEHLIDYNGIALWRKRERDNLPPLVLGVGKAKIIPGELYSDAILAGALNILRTGGRCGLGRFIEIAEIDMRDLNRIVIQTRERILITMNQGDIEAQFNKLILVLANSQRRGKIIKKVDLRYKDVYVQ